MKALLLLVLLTLNHATTMVYVCDSRGGKRYHLRADCSGLSRCTHKIIKLTMEDAEKSERTRCKLEK